MPNRPEKKTIEIDLPLGWSADSVAPRRKADVGYPPALTYVTVISAVEAEAINADFKRQAEETLRAHLAKEGIDPGPGGPVVSGIRLEAEDPTLRFRRRRARGSCLVALLVSMLP